MKNKHCRLWTLAGCIVVLQGLFADTEDVQTLASGDDLAQAVARAKERNAASGAVQEIVLGDGKYETLGEIMLDFPLIIRGGSGDPAKVTVEAQAVKNSQIYRVFTLNNAAARLESITVTGGRLTRYGSSNFYNYGAGVRIAAPFSQSQPDHSMTGVGGTVTNCVIAGNSAPDRYCGAAGVLLNSQNAVVTHTVISNNVCTRQLDNFYPKEGAIVHIVYGVVGNSLIVSNEVSAPDLNPSGAPGDRSTIVSIESSGRLENSAVCYNRIDTSFNPSIVRLSNSGKVLNTIIANNTIDAGEKLKEDWDDSALCWSGNAENYVNCAMTSAKLPSASCMTLSGDDVCDLENGDLRPSPDSLLRNAGTTDGILLPGIDLAGIPRLSEAGEIDIGPYQFDPSRPALCHVKAGNAGAVYPYATPETAAADIQTAIDAAEEGGTVVIGAGVYEIEKSIFLTKRLYVRGETGNAEDVVIRNVYAGAFGQPDNTGHGRCLLVDAHPKATVSAVTLEGAAVGGAYTLAGALYIGKDVTGDGARINWFKAGKGGCVSNVIIRNCKNSNKFGHATALAAVGSNALVTHCTVTNNTSSCGYINGATQSAFIELENGARMENSLVAFNRVARGSQTEPQGRLQSAVSLRGASKLRFCTVVSNYCSMVGGVNVDKSSSARVEYCVIARNTAYESAEHYSEPQIRHHDWGFFSFSRDNDALSGKNVALASGVVADGIAGEIEYVRDNPDVVNAVFAGCVGEHSAPGASGTRAALESVYSGIAAGKWRMKADSPARDKAAPESTLDVGAVDLLGNNRLVNGAYDAGCFEGAMPAGLRIFCK